MTVARRSRVIPLVLAAAVVLAILPGLGASAQAAAVPNATSCESQAGAGGLKPVLQLDIPTSAKWLDKTPPYSFDDTASLTGGFDRVGYCVETVSAAGTKWVWTDMEAFTKDPKLLGLHTHTGDITRQRVNDLNVESNVPGVRTGTGMPGYLEMWPNSYLKDKSDQIAGVSGSRYDADDVPTPGSYGSFQVHSVGGDPDSDVAPSTAFAINNLNDVTPIDIGMGNNPSPGGEPDWTFSGTAGSYTARTLTVFARPATVSVTAAPQDRQLYPRDADGGADVKIAGTVKASGVDAVRLEVTSKGDTETFEQNGPDFEFDQRITAGLHDYDFVLKTVSGGDVRTVGRWTHVVSGDVFVVEGQSNAQATALVEPGSRPEMSQYLRSYGTNDYQPDVSAADREWNYASGETFFNQGEVGQWGIRMARDLSEKNKVPVAIFNGAHGGAVISFLQRNDGNPDDISTNYGRLRQRLKASGTIDKISGVLFYQGESEADNAQVHVAGFTELLADWRKDFGGARDTNPPVYITQVRTSPCLNSEAVSLRDAQRRMQDTLDVTVLSPTGLSNHDGCHFGWENGYKLFGDQVAATLMRDLYGGPSEGVAAPNPVSASFASPAADKIRVQLASKTDELTVDPGVGADFRLRGSSAKVTDVRYLPRGKLELKLSGPARDITSLAYVSHNGAGPMIRTSRGVGLLAFDALPVSSTPAPELFDSIVVALQGLDARAGDLGDAGDLPSAERTQIGDVVNSALADVAAATPADGSDDSTEPQHLIDALTAMQGLHQQLRDAALDGPVLRDLDARLVTIEQLLGTAVSRSLGARIILPPVSTAALPGDQVAGTVQVSNVGDDPLTGISAKVSIDDWSVKTDQPAEDAVAAGGTLDLPFTTTVPKRQSPGDVEARATVTFTTAAGTFTLSQSTPWLTVTSGAKIGDVDVAVEPGDPAEHATVSTEVSNTSDSEIRGHLVVEGPDGWAPATPSAEIGIAAGASADLEVPLVIPANVVDGANSLNVRFERDGVVLDSAKATATIALPTPSASLDHIDFGDTASETEHSLQAAARSGMSVEAGLTRRYADASSPGSWYSAVVSVDAGKPFILRNIETFDGAHTKKYNVYVDDHLVKTQLVPRSEGGAGIKTYDLLVDDPSVLDNDGSVRIKYEYPVGATGFYDPSIADSWVLPVGADDRAPDVGATVGSKAPQGDNGWFRGTAEVTLQAADHHDPDPTLQIGEADGWSSYTGPFAVTGEGKHSVSYRAKDAAGNSTDARTVPVWIDQTAPSTTLKTSRQPGVAESDKVTLSFVATDALSGVGATTYRIDDGDWMVLGDDKPVVQGFGSHTVDYSTTDVAGNPEQVTTAALDIADVDVIQAVTPPLVTGSAVVGSTVTATTGTWNTIGLTYTYQWLRDGKAISGATGVARTLTSTDVGHRLSVTVTAAKDGAQAGSSTSAQTAKVTKAKSKVAVGYSDTSVRKNHKVRLSITATSSVTPRGTVRIYENGKRVKTLTLSSSGKVSYSLRMTKKGLRSVKVVYAGSASVSGSTSTTKKIRVR